MQKIYGYCSLLFMFLLLIFCQGQLKSSFNSSDDKDVLFHGMLQSSAGHCLVGISYDPVLENGFLGFSECTGAGADYFYWNYLYNGQIQSNITDQCVAPLSYNLIVFTNCNDTDLFQIWSLNWTQDYFLLINKGCSELQKRPVCLGQDGEYNAGMFFCDQYDTAEIFIFQSLPSTQSSSKLSIPVQYYLIFILCIFGIVSITIYWYPYYQYNKLRRIAIIAQQLKKWHRNRLQQTQGIQTDNSDLEENLLKNNDPQGPINQEHSFEFSRFSFEAESFIRQDHSSNSTSEQWLDIQIPEGVREIPITDLKKIKKLGAGGFAKVYQVEFKDSVKTKYGDLGEQQFAVKIVFKQYIQLKDELNAILKEVKAMSKLNSKYIVKLLGASFVIRPSIVMELVPQGSLEQLLDTDGYKSDQTSLSWQLKLMLNISKGIQYLHSKDVIHRDLKPANILIQDRDAAITKISDFGLAKILQTTQSKQSTNRCAGTWRYMAPEQFDRLENIDKKVDIWALGVVMQQILRGVRPWEGQNEMQRILQHTQPPDNGELPNDCPQDLTQLIKSCWKVDQIERPFANEVVEQLENFLEELGEHSNSRVGNFNDFWIIREI